MPWSKLCNFNFCLTFDSPDDMETITMWAEKKPATNVTVVEKTSHSTSETIVISEADAAKIRKDAEDAISITTQPLPCGRRDSNPHVVRH